MITARVFNNLGTEIKFLVTLQQTYWNLKNITVMFFFICVFFVKIFKKKTSLNETNSLISALIPNMFIYWYFFSEY